MVCGQKTLDFVSEWTSQSAKGGLGIGKFHSASGLFTVHVCIRGLRGPGGQAEESFVVSRLSLFSSV